MKKKKKTQKKKITVANQIPRSPSRLRRPSPDITADFKVQALFLSLSFPSLESRDVDSLGSLRCTELALPLLTATSARSLRNLRERPTASRVLAACETRTRQMANQRIGLERRG
ncbi:hypothetical protein QQF64_011161 [Cirrhinus molitorella]|uniref:Uncharacterized protein n=1 Tax=Cirrhinus molitorella TaxID=172907 RepID=A0ABR3LYF3_9TELE